MLFSVTIGKFRGNSVPKILGNQFWNLWKIGDQFENLGIKNVIEKYHEWSWQMIAVKIDFVVEGQEKTC